MNRTVSIVVYALKLELAPTILLQRFGLSIYVLCPSLKGAASRGVCALTRFPGESHTSLYSVFGHDCSHLAPGQVFPKLSPSENCVLSPGLYFKLPGRIPPGTFHKHPKATKLNACPPCAFPTFALKTSLSSPGHLSAFPQGSCFPQK